MYQALLTTIGRPYPLGGVKGGWVVGEARGVEGEVGVWTVVGI